MNLVCSHCKALKYKNEANGLCCANGKVKLIQLDPPPEPLYSLVSGIGTDSIHFLTHIQQYNNCFQMTSFGATNAVRENFMPTFKIQGQIYHRAGSLLPVSDSDNKFLQIYLRVYFTAQNARLVITENGDNSIANLCACVHPNFCKNKFQIEILKRAKQIDGLLIL
ncbi:uncharacterized protein LOC143193623 [Rhynchophorus ferrugineus]|uniref:uncharacterized protein LOC143193623 n=1 Tax=Rhynchophorus ferrugineus TaxID=354439 RepID=UPI003FCEC6CA